MAINSEFIAYKNPRAAKRIFLMPAQRESTNMLGDWTMVNLKQVDRLQGFRLQVTGETSD